jgi:hypothetical protein
MRIWIWIRIQHFLSLRIRIRIRIQIQGFDDQKLEKIHSWKKNLNFFDKKFHFTYPYTSTKDLQATGEVFSS